LARERWTLMLDDVLHRLRALIGGGHAAHAGRTRGAAAVLGALLLILILLGMYWSGEPDAFDVTAQAEATAERRGEQLVPGYTTTATLTHVARTLLDKPGGYLANDVMPPGVWLDNIPNWEYGVLVQVRDMARAMRDDLSRSQSQSTEDPDLEIAQPRFNFDSESWMFPSSESQYAEGIEALESYLGRLAGTGEPPAQFHARADNLVEWLSMAGKRLGSLSQRLSASVGQVRVDTETLPGTPGTAATGSGDEVEVRTPRLQVDDVFYEARGTAWALIHLLRAVERDFAEVLADKNATVSLRQIIRELEATQHTVWSPVILNGGGFGFFANHSLVMAAYLSRANAAMIDLRDLLRQG
jgi:hypothetical protein